MSHVLGIHSHRRLVVEVTHNSSSWLAALKKNALSSVWSVVTISKLVTIAGSHQLESWRKPFHPLLYINPVIIVFDEANVCIYLHLIIRWICLLCAVNTTADDKSECLQINFVLEKWVELCMKVIRTDLWLQMPVNLFHSLREHLQFSSLFIA